MEVVRKYWGRMSVVLGGVVLIGAAASALGIELRNPLVTRSEYEEFAESSAKKWLKLKRSERRGIRYDIERIKQKGKQPPKFYYKDLEEVEQEIKELKKQIK